MKKFLLLLSLPLILAACNLGGNNIPSGPGAEIIIPAPAENNTEVDINVPADDLDHEVDLPVIENQFNPNNIENEIAELFAVKYNYTLDQIAVTVSEYEAPGFAKGMVAFNGGGPGEEGGFLAVLDNGEWILVYDGNGMWDCDVIRSYNFPATMTAECYP